MQETVGTCLDSGVFLQIHCFFVVVFAAVHLSQMKEKRDHNEWRDVRSRMHTTAALASRLPVTAVPLQAATSFLLGSCFG